MRYKSCLICLRLDLKWISSCNVKIVCVIGDCLYQEEYVSLADSIEEIAGHYGFPVVKFESPLETFDGVHPDSYGAAYMSDRIYDVMEEENLLYYKREGTL